MKVKSLDVVITSKSVAVYVNDELTGSESFSFRWGEDIKKVIIDLTYKVLKAYDHFKTKWCFKRWINKHSKRFNIILGKHSVNINKLNLARS